ncbi:MAG: DUF2845 domain-containing protein [Proteobacteria bacterium]|jgi:hypothetical protein|nr:DUF2845 domain-containing protein [Pseudomonadota bacterium]
MKTALIILSLTLITSCAFVPERSHLAEMEHDDSTFFEPRKDFNVIPGDEGISWRTDEVWRARTPADETQLKSEREQRVLDNHLRKLESAQSEGALKHYEQIKPHLATTSERIYFLGLRGRVEREEYLSARGISADTSPLVSRSIASQGILNLGMSKSDVQASWGEPIRVDFAGNPQLENERWVYNANGAAKYIYFESGRVGGWTSASE